MAYNSIVISSGHGLKVRGASGILDEVDEARKVVNRVAELLINRHVNVKVYHDDVSTTQSENLNRIVDYHNAQVRDLDISVHFNAYEQVEGPMGCEVLYTTQSELAERVSAAISDAGFIDRGPKQRTDLFFLNQTSEPAILIETCFVDSEADAEIYEAHFELICDSIVDELANHDGGEIEAPPPQSNYLFRARGTASHFGGPNDQGVDYDEGLAFIYSVDDAPHLFLPETIDNSDLGLARRLNPYVHYIACRWDYDVTPKETLLEHMALVRATRTGVLLTAFPADWGPHEDTGRVADLSPGLMNDLRITTDDEVEVIFPYLEVPS
jgi:N-acetylmuramoyl-L-alanine amidase